MFRSRILPALVTLWGLFIIIGSVTEERTQGSASYEAGGYAVVAFAVLMVVVGVRTLLSPRRA